MSIDPCPAEGVDSAPANVQELRELVVQISRGESGLSLGTKALAVLGRMVEQPEWVAFGTITGLAEELGVNASTLSRLARSLGYTGFSEFQRVFRDNVAGERRHFYSDQGRRLLDGGSVEDDYVEVVVRLAQESVRNVDDFVAQLSAAELRGAAQMVANARRVRVYGVRQIHAVATVLSYGLGLVRSDVGLLDAPGQGIAESLAQMCPGDVLLVSSVSPYSRRVAEVSRIARAAEISVIAITDSRASPLAANSVYAFCIPHESSFISNSIGAYIVFCESFINLVAKELGDKALRALERQEQFIEALNVEMR